MRHAIIILLLATPAFAAEPVYDWKTHAGDPDRVYLYRDGQQVGGWCYQAKHYRAFDGRDWGAPSDAPPVKLPAARLVITPPPPPMVLAAPSAPLRPLRGPLRVRLGTAMANTIVDMTMQMMEQIPAAVADSVKKGNYTLEFKSSATRTPPKTPNTPPR